MPTYGQYISSVEWKTKRALVLKLAKGRCECCKQRKATQVHHLTYARLFHEELTDLIAVCQNCHADKHPDKPQMRRHLKLPKKLRCPWCQKKMSTERGLAQHMAIRHGPGKKPTIEQLDHDRREAERTALLNKGRI